MSWFRRGLIALAIGAAGTIVPATSYAGGGVGGGGVGGGGVAGGSLNGGGFPGNPFVRVGALTPPGHNYAPLDYYPRKTTVHQGDVVTFHWAGDPNALHTMTLLPANVTSDRQVNRLFPGAGGPIPDKDDPGHAVSFPFNLFQQACGNSPYYPGTAPCVYTGSNLVNSGFLVPAVASPATGALVPGVPLPTFSVRFNAKPGTYRFFCLVHGPAMNATITVVPNGAPTTTPAQAVAKSAAQYQTQNKNAEASESKIKTGPTPGAAGHTNFIVSAGSGYGRIEMNQFYPGAANIKAGDSVTWIPGGFHTVTFPPPNGPALFPQCETPSGQDRPFTGRFAGCNLEVGLGAGAAPSGNPAAYAGGTLGSGILVVPKPHAFTVTFTKPGKYLYFCLVHARMGGFIIVH